jgi:hypothetical protein
MVNETIKAKLSCGEVTLRKPTAGMRNAALVLAETDTGFKKSLMMIELLPPCILAHPWGMTKVKDALNALSIQDYDLLIDGLEKMMSPDDELKKKSNEQLDQPEKENLGLSE